jgi:hypothetical protein
VVVARLRVCTGWLVCAGSATNKKCYTALSYPARHTACCILTPLLLTSLMRLLQHQHKHTVSTHPECMRCTNSMQLDAGQGRAT